MMLAYRTVSGSRTSMCFVTSSPHAVCLLGAREGLVQEQTTSIVGVSDDLF